MQLLTFVAFQVVLFGFTTLFFGARIFFDARRYRFSSLSIGNILSAVFAAFAFINYGGMFAVSVWRGITITENDKFQHEPLYIRPLGVMYDQAENMLKIILVENYTVPTGAWAVKASFLAFYFTLHDRLGRRMRVFLYISVFYIAATYFVLLGITIGWCQPFERHWSLDPRKTCAELLFIDYIIIYTILNVTGDIFVIAVPSFLVFNLPLQHRDKYGILFLIGLGVLTITATISRSVVMGRMNHDLASLDPRAEQVAMTELLSSIELAAAILASSLPSLRAIIWSTRRKRTLRGKHDSSLALTPKGGVMSDSMVSRSEVLEMTRDGEDDMTLKRGSVEIVSHSVGSDVEGIGVAY